MNTPPRIIRAALLTATFLLAAVAPTLAQAGTGVRINRVELAQDIVQTLAQYNIRIAPGDYWYDAFSGLY
ncbi:MAG: hypothetical protein ABL963_15255, partial [Longimicrobiales bacterium]